MQLIKLKLIGVEEPSYIQWRNYGRNRTHKIVPYSMLTSEEQRQRWYMFRKYVLKATGGWKREDR